jgi:hypothetical protein
MEESGMNRFHHSSRSEGGHKITTLFDHGGTRVSSSVDVRRTTGINISMNSELRAAVKYNVIQLSSEDDEIAALAE